MTRAGTCWGEKPKSRVTKATPPAGGTRAGATPAIDKP
jgi:hypothetical protein